MELLNKINEELKYYEVQRRDDVPIMCEDNEYRVRYGYIVYNTEAGVIEHTTTLLPGAIFQAQHLDSMLEGLLNPAEQPEFGLAQMPMEDVVAN